MRTLHVHNVGTNSCKYSWKLVQGKKVTHQPADPTLAALKSSEQSGEQKEIRQGIISVNPGSGVVSAGESKPVTMTFQPNRIGKIPNSELIMEVRIAAA